MPAPVDEPFWHILWSKPNKEGREGKFKQPTFTKITSLKEHPKDLKN